MIIHERVLVSPYREEVRGMYPRLRDQIAGYFTAWGNSYALAAAHFKIPFDGSWRSISNIPYEMEDRTYDSERQRRPSHCFVISGPQCVGKTTLQRRLSDLGFDSVPNHKTRPMRPGEIEGVDGIFITEEELAGLQTRGELFFVNNQNHSAGEEPYKSGFGKTPFFSAFKRAEPFFIERTLNGWGQLRDNLLEFPDGQDMMSRISVIFLLPPAPHVLALRALNRTITNFMKDGERLTEEGERRISTEFERALAKTHLVEESFLHPEVTYLVNDNIDRVSDKIIELTQTG